MCFGHRDLYNSGACSICTSGVVGEVATIIHEDEQSKYRSTGREVTGIGA